MINLNLLPPAERASVLKGIKARFFAVLALFVFIWGSAALAFVGLGWIFLRIQNDALAKLLRIEESTDVALQTQAFEAGATRTNSLLSYAAQVATQPQDDGAYLAGLISSLAPAGVHLHSLVINSASAMITIGGIADTRDELLAFQQRLQSQNSVFAGVESPLSNILSPANISFSFLVTLIRK